MKLLAANITHAAILLAAILLSACYEGSSSSNPPTATPRTSAVTPRIAEGAYHTVAIKSDGSLWAWGSNASGQLGDGTTTDSWTPKQIGTGYTEIAPGTTHTVALKSDGSLWAWGSNSCGQLGDGTTTDSLVPKQIGTGYISIAAGAYYTLAVKSDGTLWTWGDGGCLAKTPPVIDPTPKQIGTGYSAVIAGYDHNFAFKPDGSLWAWGNNSNGELGDGAASTADILSPKLIHDGIPTAYTSIAAGFQHTVALRADGSLWTWGGNKYGQLGHATNTSINTDTLPQGIGNGYAAIAAGFQHSVAVKSDGTLWTWGDNSLGQLGDGAPSATIPTLAPKQIGTGYTTIAAGSWNTFAIKSDGSLWAWGYNFFGQLGDGTNTDSSIPKQIFASGFSSATGGPVVVPFTTSYAGSYSGIATAQNIVIRDQAAWSDLWTNEFSYIASSSPALPSVDFNTNMVLGVFAGTFPVNACVGAAISRVTKINQDITVEYRMLTSPAISCVENMTSNPIRPSQLISVPLSSGSVTFVQK